jgi:hypothetical protein
MNAKAILAAAALLIAAGSTFAADTNEAAFDQAFRNTGTSTLTREQVIAETIAARKAGLLDINEAYRTSPTRPPSRNGASEANNWPPSRTRPNCALIRATPTPRTGAAIPRGARSLLRINHSVKFPHRAAHLEVCSFP